MQDRVQEVMSTAADLFSRKPDWLEFYRGILGVDGAVRTAFPTAEALGEFEQCDEYAQIERMLATLREQSQTSSASDDTTRVITVRMPAYMHESLKEEAQERRISINRLCLAKLVQRLTSSDAPARRETAPETPVQHASN